MPSHACLAAVRVPSGGGSPSAEGRRGCAQVASCSQGGGTVCCNRTVPLTVCARPARGDEGLAQNLPRRAPCRGVLRHSRPRAHSTRLQFHAAQGWPPLPGERDPRHLSDQRGRLCSPGRAVGVLLSKPIDGTGSPNIFVQRVCTAHVLKTGVSPHTPKGTGQCVFTLLF